MSEKIYFQKQILYGLCVGKLFHNSIRDLENIVALYCGTSRPSHDQDRSPSITVNFEH